MALDFGLFNNRANNVGLNPKNWNVISIPPSAFFPTTSNPNFTASPGDIKLTSNSADDLYIWINLPQEATLTEIIVYGNALATNDDFALYRVNHSGTAVNIRGAGTGQAIGTAMTDLLEVIDNENYSYVIKIDQTYNTGDSTWILYGARIKFALE